ncbi:hypothetical protein D3C87_377250 [compost metagenome]
MPSKLNTVTTLCGIAALVLAFQNCSEFAMDERFIRESSLMESRDALDAASLPRLLQSTNIGFWRKTGSADFNRPTSLISEGGTLVVALSKNNQGEVLSLGTSTTKTEQMSIEVANGKVRAVRYTTADNYLYMEANVPAVGTSYVVAARFGVQATDAALMINGILQTAEVKKVGTPLETFFVQRFPAVGVTGGSPVEAVIYIENLKNTDLNVMSRYIASNQGIPNVLYDPALVNEGAVGPVAPTPEFLAAKAIIDSKCLSCHNTNEKGNLSGLTQSKAVAMGWVVPKSPATSKMYYRLIGSAGGGTKNMPMGGSFSAAEVSAVANWINSIN